MMTGFVIGNVLTSSIRSAVRGVDRGPVGIAPAAVDTVGGSIGTVLPDTVLATHPPASPGLVVEEALRGCAGGAPR